MSYGHARTPFMRWITGGLVAAMTATVVSSSIVPSAAVSSTSEGPAPASQVGPAGGDLVAWEGVTHRVTPQRGAGFTAYAVPTSDAGLGNIVTAPNGDMWFVEADSNQVGRITPAGVITEYDLGPTTTGDGSVMDVTVAADGAIWVVYDQGWRAMRIDPNLVNAQPYSLGEYPYGEDVEMGPDGVPWVTMSFDEDGVSRILPTGAVWHRNAPPCDGALARANDGGMWCESDDAIIKINADASGGTTYPLPDNATDPRSLAAGPVGSMWFARYYSTMLTSASRGDIGWIDQRTGRTTIFKTGNRTGPFDVTRGPDDAMWFANRGAGRGIGHVHTNGTGAITAVGDFSPRNLTFDKRGMLWFTDPAHNVIVKVNPSQLQRTDVEVGSDSVMLAPARIDVVGKVVAGTKPVRVRKGRLRVRITCPRSARTACSHTAVLTHRKKARKLSKQRTYSVSPGRSKVVALTLNRAGKRQIRRTAVTVRVVLTARFGHASRATTIRARR